MKHTKKYTKFVIAPDYSQDVISWPGTRSRSRGGGMICVGRVDFSRSMSPKADLDKRSVRQQEYVKEQDGLYCDWCQCGRQNDFLPAKQYQFLDSL